MYTYFYLTIYIHPFPYRICSSCFSEVSTQYRAWLSFVLYIKWCWFLMIKPQWLNWKARHLQLAPELHSPLNYIKGCNPSLWKPGVPKLILFYLLFKPEIRSCWAKGDGPAVWLHGLNHTLKVKSIWALRAAGNLSWTSQARSWEVCMSWGLCGSRLPQSLSS